MNALTALEAAEAAAQGNDRLNTLKKHDSEELRDVLRMALDPAITFGIKKLPAPDKNTLKSINGDEGWYRKFTELASMLANRDWTGKVAQNAVAEFLGACDENQRKWTERILKQDLRINVGAKDVNNAFENMVIQIFEVPLATDYAKVKPKDLKGQWVMEPKLDGGRAVAVLPKNQGKVRLLSRTGKEWNNFESIRAKLQRWNDARQGPTIYLDGEVVSLDEEGRIDFQQIQKTMMRKDGVEVGRLQYVVFDYATEDEWYEPKLPYSERLDQALDTVQSIATDASDLTVVAVAPRTTLVDPMVALLESWCTQFVHNGYEGAMARRADLPVENKRSKRLIKIKTFQDDEGEVIGAVEGTGKYAGMLGALQCKHKNGKEFEIGSGFDDAQRQEFWANHNDLGLPRLVSFKFFELTDDGIPRFPIFRYFRSEQDV
jgi:ATP-dependent DNA ligase